MLKKWSYILIVIAVFLAVGHNAVAHHHHAFGFEHHDDGDDHDDDDALSFGQLDECYTYSNNEVSFTPSAVLSFIVQAFFKFDSQKEICYRHFFSEEDYPPLDDPYLRSSSLRGPPLS